MLRKHWEEESGKLGDSFFLEAHIQREDEVIWCDAIAAYDQVHGFGKADEVIACFAAPRQFARTPPFLISCCQTGPVVEARAKGQRGDFGGKGFGGKARARFCHLSVGSLSRINFAGVVFQGPRQRQEGQEQGQGQGKA